MYIFGYKLYLGGVWRDEYLVIDFEVFQATRAGLHIADHDTNEVYVPGTAPNDKEQPSFPVRDGAIRPLSSDGLTAQTSPDSDVPWAEDIISAMDSHDQPQVLDPTGPVPEIAPDEEDY